MLVNVILPPFIKIETQAYTTEQRSKAIHIVYDDSGSMVRTRETRESPWTYLDRWGQAKYAMEVFAAMLEERDVMNVYYMSDFDTTAGGNINAPPKITIHGSESASARVAKIHNTVTRAANTPFDPVVKAYNDLKVSGADEQWLVILSDGFFNRLGGDWNYDIDVNGILTRYANDSDVKIILLAIGDDADLLDMVRTIKPDPSIDYYMDHARNSNEILGKITTICNQIFNRNILRFSNVTRREFNFDIPMTELLVFAQGDNISINGIRGDGSYNPNETVNVRYSEVAGTNFTNDANVIVSRNLTGVVASFQNIPKGSYNLDITGAQTVEIYYKPSVNVDVRLYQNGQEIQTQNFVEGEYQIYYGIVNENGDFFESSLLGRVDYEAVVENAGESYPVQSGGTINLKRGDFTLNARARFLEINTAENTITRRVLAEATPLDVEIKIPDDDFTVTKLKDSGAFVVTVRHEGRLLSESQWVSMALPEISTNVDVNITDVRRGADVSTFEFNIRRIDGDLRNTSTGDVKINVSAGLIFDEQLCEGENSVTVNIKPAPPLDIHVKSPGDELSVTHLNDTEAFIITVRKDNNLLTEEQWQNMPPPVVTTSAAVDITEVKHGSEVSTFEFYIKQKNNNKHETSKGSILLNIYAEAEIDASLFVSEESINVDIKNDISIIERVLYWLGTWWWLLVLIFIFLGYTPLFKKRLSKKLKRSPRIRGVNNGIGADPKPSTGEYKKEFLYTILPYFAERGTIRYAPRSVSGAPRLVVRGAGNRSVKVMNTKSFAGKDHIKFNRRAVPKDERKPMVQDPATSITVTVNNITYTCNPTQ